MRRAPVDYFYGRFLMVLAIVWTTVHCNVDSSATATASPVLELCHTELFQPTCADDEVITMETAQYGRLNIGRCVTEDFGYLRCLHDVMPEVESACSGRRSCKVRVDDVTFNRVIPCHRDLKSNLLVSYRCTKVVMPNTPCKHSLGGESIIDTTASPAALSGLVSSYVTDETGCGTTDWPWAISAGPGQRINLTLYDFSREAAIASLSISPSVDGLASGRDPRQHHQQHGGAVGGTSQHQRTADQSSMTCRVYATIRDNSGGRSTTVCGGLARTGNVFMSATNRVEIRFLRQQKSPQSASGGGQSQQSAPSSATVEYSHFLMRYDVVGCIDPVMYPGMQMKRDGDVITISCDANTMSAEAMWQMTCVGNRWYGSYGNCTNGLLFSSSTFNYASPVIIIVVIAICVVCFILTVGTFCIRWRLRKDYGGSYSAEVRTEPVDVIADYDYQYRTSSTHHQPPLPGLVSDKAGIFPVRTRYPMTTASYDTTSSAAVLAGNEYATMRLLQLAPYTDLPPGVGGSDRQYTSGGDSSRTSGFVTEHIYESPDSMRRGPLIGGVQGGSASIDELDRTSATVGGSISGSSVVRPPYRVFEPSASSAVGISPWDHRTRMLQQQQQQQMASATSGGGGSPRTAMAIAPAAAAPGLCSFNGERYEMPIACGIGGEQQRFPATQATGNYSL